MAYNFDLVFLAPGPTDLPGNPIARIRVINSEYIDCQGGDSRDVPVISSQCQSLREIENEIDRLKIELEEIRKQARIKFQ
ncbi:MAG: hypothetical protein D4R81_04990 [Nitrospiraceae bacterium]|nr:MAG: hypothetical protein D4R81_04990 [Nitrospiraceae bacterium]